MSDDHYLFELFAHHLCVHALPTRVNAAVVEISAPNDVMELYIQQEIALSELATQVRTEFPVLIAAGFYLDAVPCYGAPVVSATRSCALQGDR
jgi:hypothetical protein